MRTWCNCVVSKEEVLELLREKQRRLETRRLEQYNPYQYQTKFHLEGNSCAQRILMAANRVGKTYCGAAETAYHLTGQYPEWWEGRRFTKPIRAWAAGESNDTTRDIIQKELLATHKTRQRRTLALFPWTTSLKQCVNRVYQMLSHPCWSSTDQGATPR